MRAKLLAILTSLLLVSGICFADTSGEAVSHVYVEVVANVAVAVVDATVELGQIQTGPFDGTITFRVDANVEAIDLQVAVTDLYKGDSLTAEATIPVAQDAGVTVQPANGNETKGGDNNLAFEGTGMIKEFPAATTEVGNFESGQKGHFSQEVDVTVTWNQPDPELPTGEYSGYVMLTAMIPGV